MDQLLQPDIIRFSNIELSCENDSKLLALKSAHLYKDVKSKTIESYHMPQIAVERIKAIIVEGDCKQVSFDAFM
jgi:hypothetical protein